VKTPPVASPGAAVRLAPDTVAVWEADLDDLCRRLPDPTDALSPPERRRGERLLGERDRRRFYARRTFLRMVLGRHLERDPGSIRIEAVAGRKPVVPDAQALHFNASSSGDTALVAVSGAEIGVDIEEVDDRSDIDGLARRWLSADEQSRLRRLDPAEHRRVVFATLTQKEAALKAAGVGLALDPRLLSGETGVDASALIEVPTRNPSWWWVTPLPLSGDVVGALATGLPEPRVIRLGRYHAATL